MIRRCESGIDVEVVAAVAVVDVDIDVAAACAGAADLVGVVAVVVLCCW
jgi:hypothetical protein